VRRSREFLKYEDLLTSCDIGLSTVIIKKKLMSRGIKFSNSKTKEDFYLWLKLLSTGVKLSYLNDNLSYWRKVKNSLSSSNFQKIRDGYKLYNFYLGYNKIKSLYFLAILSLNFMKNKFK
jgi:teichuronic acid biosynthesis glycosyltransferase TuaG